MKPQKNKVLIIDTSAILSGKPLILDDHITITTPGVSDELKPGGRDYRNFQYLIERGLKIIAPEKKFLEKIQGISQKTGDIGRLSKTDMEILAVALEKTNIGDEVVIITDDYSIQNIAETLEIPFQTISQRGIKKKFKWEYRCQGCKKKFEEHIKVCPICGAQTKPIISKKTDIKKVIKK